MLRFCCFRLLSALGMALLATLIIFLITNTVPGDPVLAQLGDLAASNAEFVAAMRERYGLNLPLWQRYFVFLYNLLHGDLGISITSHRPVLTDIKAYAPATIELATLSFLLALIVGLPLGIVAAVKRDGWPDHVARFISLLGVSSPTFWLAFIMLSFFYGYLGIAPGPGRLDPISLPPEGSGFYLYDTIVSGDWEAFRDVVSHLILPTVVLAAATTGLITRTARAAMLEVIYQDYVRMGRAKGLTERYLILRHVLPNALIPIVTMGGLAYAELLTGAVMTETVFSWPGLGRYTFDSAATLDLPAIMGVTLIVALVYLLINFLVDVSYVLLDPRVRR